MGTIVYTRDGEGLYDHEGYVTHVLDDGSSAHGTWTVEIEERTVSWQAECICGWTGPVHDSGGPATPDQDQYDAVLADWDTGHALPLVRAAERVFQLEALAEAVRAADRQLRDGVAEAVRRGASWEEISKATTTSVERLQRLLGVTADLDTGPTADPIGLGLSDSAPAI